MFLDDILIKARERSKVVMIFQSLIAIEKIALLFSTGFTANPQLHIPSSTL